MVSMVPWHILSFLSIIGVGTLRRFGALMCVNSLPMSLTAFWTTQSQNFPHKLLGSSDDPEDEKAGGN